MALLSKASRSAVADPLLKNNPIGVQVLGICSALAVTVRVDQAVIMTAAVVFVLSMSNSIISLIRSFNPNRTRIIIQLSIIAGLVTFIDEILQAYMYDMSKQLTVFFGLIINNFIFIGRSEAFSNKNSLGKSFLDGMGNGLGYGGILIVVSFFRELLGSGTLYGYQVVPQWAYENGYENLGLMVLSPGAFIVLGLIVWLQLQVAKPEDH